jgi:alkylation response protein AidB-like acyl-CoA dehydrogenase
VHIHGGAGIDLSHPAHRYFVAARHCEFMLGGATVQLRRLGAELAGAAAKGPCRKMPLPAVMAGS